MFALGMTTAPRDESTIDRSIGSLRAAGFLERLYVFAEPGSTVECAPDVEVRRNETRLGALANWRTALRWLVVNTSEPWICLAQDDAEYAVDAHERLIQGIQDNYSRKIGYLSLYTPIHMRKYVPSDDGWFIKCLGWQTWGALFYCMPRSSAEALLTCDKLHTYRRNQQIDAIVSEFFEDQCLACLWNNPSLADHIGLTSTLGHRSSGPSSGGYRFKKRA